MRLDDLIRRNSQILALPSASKRDLSSLRNWVETTGSIARDETAFLEEKDVLTTGSSGNDAFAVIEPKVEGIFIGIYELLSKVNILSHLFAATKMTVSNYSFLLPLSSEVDAFSYFRAWPSRSFPGSSSHCWS